MRGVEPGWWYGATSRAWQPQVLAPFGWVYGTLTSRRMRAAPVYRPDVPVVCIGNFTAGGTGKTPFVREVCEQLCVLGHTPVVLSRGYGGSTAGPHWVDPPADTASAVGDEPLLLALHVPVVIARDRAAGAKAIVSAAPPHPRATVIVMDDGIQNPSLAKDLTIAVIDAVRGVGDGRCIPAGPLRAPLAIQLPQVDAVVLNRGVGDAPLAASTQALVDAFGGPVLSAAIVPARGLEWLRGLPVVAYAGIGVPARFFATVEACGGIVCKRIVFPDHHAFTDADARRLLALAQAEDMTLLTTEKDHARLSGLAGACADLRAATRTLPITLCLDDESVTTLGVLLASRVPVRS